MSGWAKVHRSLTHHWLWGDKPFSKGQAWIDLILSANHRDGIIFVRGIPVEINRGECGHSEVTLAKRWGWSRGKVRRFVGLLKMHQMVATRQDNKTTIITILEYDKCQGREDDDGTASSTANSTANGQQTGTNKNEKNEKKKNKNIPSDFIEFANRFQQWISDNRGKQAPPITDALINSGAETLERLVRIDKFSLSEIREALRWAVDDDFWSGNLFSLASLRKKGKNDLTKFQNIYNAWKRSTDTGLLSPEELLKGSGHRATANF